MSKKRILLIIPEMSMGGAQRSLSKLSLELSQQHQVYLVVFNTHHKIEYAHGGELLSLDVVPGAGIFGKLVAFAKRISRLRKLKMELSIEVAISFLEGADYVNILSRLKENVIISIRGSKRHDETIVGRFHFVRNRILIPWLYKKVKTIVTVNKGIAKELIEHYGLENQQIVTIHNFYDTQEIQSLAAEPKPADVEKLYKHPVLVTSGRLSPEKGLIALVNVFYGVKKRRPELKLVMVGDGPSYFELVRLCQQLNLRVETKPDFESMPDVLFLGAQTNVFKYLTGATLYLMNSSSEGFPNGLVEAMICKVPVVSSDCPYGPREILEPDFKFIEPVSAPYASSSGILMPIIRSGADEECWIESIIDLLGKREILFQFAAQANLQSSRFEKRNIMLQWQEIL